MSVRVFCKDEKNYLQIIHVTKSNLGRETLNECNFFFFFIHSREKKIFFVMPGACEREERRTAT